MGKKVERPPFKPGSKVVSETFGEGTIRGLEDRHKREDDKWYVNVKFSENLSLYVAEKDLEAKEYSIPSATIYGIDENHNLHLPFNNLVILRTISRDELCNFERSYEWKEWEEEEYYLKWAEIVGFDFGDSSSKAEVTVIPLEILAPAIYKLESNLIPLYKLTDFYVEILSMDMVENSIRLNFGLKDHIIFHEYNFRLSEYDEIDPLEDLDLELIRDILMEDAMNNRWILRGEGGFHYNLDEDGEVIV